MSQPRNHYYPPRKKKKKNPAAGCIILFILIAIIAALTFWLTRPKDGSAAQSNTPASSASVPAVASGSQSEAVQEPVSSSEVTPTEMPPLFNYQNSIPEEYYSTLQLAPVGDGHQMQQDAAAAFKDMQAAATADGINLFVVSGYRSHERQVNNYNRSIQNYISQGYDEAKATELTQEYYAIPGTSEHEAGLAVDINSLEERFSQTKEFTWLQENCTKYGFILRYDKGKEEITKIEYEPWHYRYVGLEHAQAIAEQSVTLEEYVGTNPATPVITPYHGPAEA